MKPHIDKSQAERYAAAPWIAAGIGLAGAGLLYRRRRGSSRRLPAPGLAPPGVVRIERVTTINRSVDEVYAFWRRFENFPLFMRHLQSVETLPNGRSRWRARGPAGIRVTWEAELIEDRQGEWIAWRSVPGSGIQNSGSVRFSPAPGARGTEVRVQLQYSPPAGSVGRGIAWLFGEEPDQQIHHDLHRFKQLMETGEVPLSDGPGLWRAAQPADPKTIRSLAGVKSR